jgi:hypothetical protein
MNVVRLSSKVGAEMMELPALGKLVETQAKQTALTISYILYHPGKHIFPR